MVLNSQTLALLTAKYTSLKRKKCFVIVYKIVSKSSVSTLQCIHLDSSVSFTPPVLIENKKKSTGSG